jgi:hypothetical protein
MSVSRNTSTVSNQWFTTSKSGSKGRSYRPRRSAEHQARLDAAKTEHVAASHAADHGEWVVKGKRHNKMAAKEQTPQEKAEAARLKQLKDLKAIEKTLSGSMSVIRPRKRTATSQGGNPKKPKIVLEEKKPKGKNKIGAMNSFTLLAVDSTDDEDEVEAELEVKPIEIKPQDFPTLGAPIKVQASSNISYSFALKSKPTKKQIGPQDFPSPPKTRVCWADHLDDQETSDEEDDLPMRPGQSWGDFA